MDVDKNTIRGALHSKDEKLVCTIQHGHDAISFSMECIDLILSVVRGSQGEKLKHTCS